MREPLMMRITGRGRVEQLLKFCEGKKKPPTLRAAIKQARELDKRLDHIEQRLVRSLRRR